MSTIQSSLLLWTSIIEGPVFISINLNVLDAWRVIALSTERSCNVSDSLFGDRSVSVNIYN